MAIRLTHGLSALALGAAVPAFAQVPGQVAPTREEIERARPPAEPRRAPTLIVEGGPARLPCPLDEERFRDVTVTIGTVLFDGLRGLDPARLAPAYEGSLGRPLPISVVCDIRDAASAILEREGYIAVVRVPPQTIEGGTLRFSVVQARMVGLRVRGDAGRAEALIAAYLEPLTRQPAFNARTAERRLLLAGDIPGYDVRLTLRPAETPTPGEVIGEVTVVRRPVDVDFNLQNFGSRDVGRTGGLLRTQFYGVTGLGDRTSIGLFTTAELAEQRVLQLGHDMKLGGRGLGLGARFTYAWTDPQVDGLTLEARTLVAALEATFPIVRSQPVNLRWAAGLEYIDQDVHIGPDPKTGPLALLSRDHLRIAYFRADGEMTDRPSLLGRGGYSFGLPRWRAAGFVELRQGLDIFNASGRCGTACVLGGTTPPSRLGADPQAPLIRAGASIEHRPVPGLTFAFSPRAQYARSQLASFEEFSAGNYTVGRGWDPGTLTGDSGLGFQAEVRAGSLAPRSLTAVAWEPFAFVDQAWLWNRGPRLGPETEKLTSVGGGVRLAYGDRARLDLIGAFPVSRVGPATVPGQPSPGRSARVLFTLTTRLFPWTLR